MNTEGSLSKRIVTPLSGRCFLHQLLNLTPHQAQTSIRPLDLTLHQTSLLNLPQTSRLKHRLLHLNHPQET